MGMQFAAGNEMINSRAEIQASGTYSVDLLGSASGALLTSIILVPILGIIVTSQSIAALNAITITVILLKSSFGTPPPAPSP
jgi:hypothetical protein